MSGLPVRPIEMVTSARNETVKFIGSLAQRKYRDETALFAAEGLGFAAKARSRKFEPRFLLIDRSLLGEAEIDDLLSWAAEEGGRIIAVPKTILARLSGKDNPQGAYLVCKQRWAKRLKAGLSGRDVVLALESIRDPGNLGTIIRTADAAEAAGIVLVGACCDPYSPEAVRASMGSIFSVPLVKFTIDEFTALATIWPGEVIGTEGDAEDSFRSRYSGPVLVVMGNESEGLSQAMRRICTRLVRIPMRTGVDSLNIASAAALMLYEAGPLRGDPTVRSRSADSVE